VSNSRGWRVELLASDSDGAVLQQHGPNHLSSILAPQLTPLSDERRERCLALPAARDPTSMVHASAASEELGLLFVEPHLKQ